MKNLISRIGVLVLVMIHGIVAQAQRFPKPEFESGYVQKITQIPAARANYMEYLDVLVLLLALLVATWLVLKKRSRIGVLLISVFSIGYFGFFREGCVCSVGSVQNIALALFQPGYKIPVTVLAFFILPLIFSLLFGRVFCAGVCPLGAIQDLFVWKPIQLRSWLQSLLGLIPFIYLGLAVLYAATATDFVICRYDPFIGIFRMDGTFTMIALGVIFLLTSVFVARPYCRFFCPYGVLLNLTSRISKYHLTITPSKCIQCRLCENSCPFGAIQQPESARLKESPGVTTRRFLVLTAIIPLLVVLGIWTGAQFHEKLALVHPKIRLAQEVMLLSDSEEHNAVVSIEMEAFRASGKTRETLIGESHDILNNFRLGSMWLGGFLGLVFGLTLAELSTFKFRKDYEPNKGTCLSCARCIEYCPVQNDI